ncbi:MAG: HIT domain-containing protein [Alphaproteobacteria bacterium]|nr:HIT domain-containing protein [Alphaproteobacteria bacterium]
MSLHGVYDDDNIFAKILRGEAPCAKVFEDDVALAMMDLFPQSRGHTLVLPKGVRARNFLDFPSDLVGPYLQRVQRIAAAVASALNPDGVQVMQFNGAPAGQTIFHLHFHVIPRWEGQPLGVHGGGKMADKDDLAALAAQIAAASP